MWDIWLEDEESHQAVKFASILQEELSHEVPRNFLFGKKLKLFYQILYSHYKYPHYPWIVRSAF